jgi:hypothetical protein
MAIRPARLRHRNAPLFHRPARPTWKSLASAAQGSEIAVRVTNNFKNEPAPYDGRLGNFAPGDYALRVRVAAGSDIKEMLYQGVPITDGTLHVAAGANGTLRIIATQGAAALTCTTADPDGHPIADSTVVLVPEKATTRTTLTWRDVANLRSDNQPMEWRTMTEAITSLAIDWYGFEISAHNSRHPGVPKSPTSPNEDMEVDFFIPPNASISGTRLARITTFSTVRFMA